MSRGAPLQSPLVRDALVLALTLLCVLAFAPVARNQFVAWDDDWNFQNNDDFRGLGARQIAWAWRTNLLGVYQPLGWMLCEAEYARWGLDPRAYHLVSVGLHVLNAFLLFLLAVRVVRLRLPELAGPHPAALSVSAALGVALYALHPLRVEVVAWASCQSYIPCVTCYLLSLLAYLRYRTATAPARRWLALSWVCFLAALLFKALAVTLPLAVILLDRFLFPRRRGRGVVAERLFYILPAVVFMALTMRVRESRVPIAEDGVYTRAAFASASVWFYWLKSAVPAALSNLYFVPDRIDAAQAEYLLALVGFLAAGVGLWLGRRRWPAGWATWLGYLCLLGPSSGLVRSGAQVFADRYSYLPMMALTPAVVAGFFLLLTRAARPWRLAVAPAVLLLPVLVVLSRQQCAVWHDTEALWRHNLAHGGDDNPRAHAQLGDWLLAQHRDEEALAQFETTVRLDPDYPSALQSAGLLLMRRRAYPEAEAHLARYVQLEPGQTAARCRLAQALSFQGKTSGALDLLRETVRQEASNPEVHYQIGFALMRTPQLAEAVTSLEEAIRLDPARPEYHLDLGIALVEAGQPVRALTHLLDAERLRPDDGETQVALGQCLARLGRLAEALPHLRRGVDLDPTSAYAHGNLGVALALRGADAEAREALATAVRLDPRPVHFRFQLARTLVRLKDHEGAREHLREVLRLDPGHAGARRALDALSARGSE
jgi:tetratricopeptide (TPR) repeat protein